MGLDILLGKQLKRDIYEEVHKMGHDDMQRKTTRFSAHAHDPLARVWAQDYANLALNPAYEKSAAPFSKRRNASYQPVDRSAGGFFGLTASQKAEMAPRPLEFIGRSIQSIVQAIPPASIGLGLLAAVAALYYRSKR